MTRLVGFQRPLFDDQTILDEDPPLNYELTQIQVHICPFPTVKVTPASPHPANTICVNFKLKTGTGQSARPSTKSGCEVGPLCAIASLRLLVDLRRCQCGPAFGVRVPSGPKWQGTTCPGSIPSSDSTLKLQARAQFAPGPAHAGGPPAARLAP